MGNSRKCFRGNALKASARGTKTLEDSICILADNNRRLKADKLAFWWKVYTSCPTSLYSVEPCDDLGQDAALIASVALSLSMNKASRRSTWNAYS
jgi:hypothetical protein